MPWFLSPSGWPTWADDGGLFADRLSARGWQVIDASQVQAAVDAYNAGEPPPPPADFVTDDELTAQLAGVLNRANHTGVQPASSISDLTEVVQDIVAALVVAGTGLTVSYNDAAGTFTINATGGGGATDPEIVRDVIGTALVASSGIQITVNDAGDTITIASTAVLPTRTVSAGTGLTGGGDLSANRSFAVDFGTGAGKVTQGNDSRVVNAVQNAAGVTTVRAMTQAAYDALGTKDASTLYVING